RFEQAGRFVDAVIARCRTVAVGERGEPLEVLAALLRECVPEVVQVVLDRVPLADRAQLFREVRFGILDVGDRFIELHRLTFRIVSRTPPPPTVAGTSAATGSEAVVVGAGAGDPSPSASLRTRTAASLKSGCFETGSQSVIVSSFAARGRPFGCAPSGSSQ